MLNFELDHEHRLIERSVRASRAAEGTRDIHKLMQADYLLGYRTDRTARCVLPPWQE